MPRNHHMAERGVDDSRTEALAYMTTMTAGRSPTGLLERYVDRGPGHRGRPRAHHPAAAAGHVVARLPPRDGRGQGRRPHAGAGAVRAGALGPWAERLRRAPVLGLPLTLQEATADWRPAYFPERFDAAEIGRRVADRRMACGQALIGALLLACLQRGIEPVLETRAAEIAMDGGGGVGARGRVGGAAVAARRPGRGAGLRRLRVERRPAVPLPARPAHPSPLPAHQRGRRTAHGHGGGRRPGQHERGVVVPGGLRCPARSTRAGRWPASWGWSGPPPTRSSSTASGSASSTRRPTTTTCRRPSSPSTPTSTPPEPALLGGLRPAVPVALPGGGGRPGDPDPEWLPVARVAGRPGRPVGIDPVGLAETVERWNRFVADGRDRDYGRGQSAYDRFHGDPSAPHPNLGTIEQGPFYALPVHVGSVGTKGGPRVDGDGRVLHVHDRPDPRPLRRRQRGRQSGRPGLLRGRDLDRHGPGLGPPGRDPRRIATWPAGAGDRT